MKILHTADLHLGKTLNGYSLLDDQKYIIKQIEDIIIKENVDTVVIAGDIFDRAISSVEALDLFGDFVGFINKNGKKLIAILGNHDGERIAYLNHILKQNNIYIIDEVTRIKIDDTIFSCIPYLNIHQFREFYNEEFNSVDEAYKYAIDDLGFDNNYFNVMVAHDYFTYHMEKLMESDSEIKYMVGGLEYLDIEIFNNYDYVALGHMHKAQQVGRLNVRYSGSILKYSFSEVKGNKSVVIIDSKTKSFIEYPLIPKRDLVDIKGSLSELINPEFYKNYNYNNDYFRAILTDDAIDAYATLKSIYPYLMEIKKENEVVNNVIERKVIKENDYLELFSMFYNEVEKKDISDNELLIVKDYLLGGAK